VSGQRKALIIANDEYDQEALQDLLAPAADAEALGRVLGDRQIGDFTVQVVRNESAHVIQAHVEELFSESRPDDVLLLHFSGHGLKSESGELFFAASNTRPNRLGSTAVSADFVQRCMQATRSRSVVLLLDCCYGGAFAQGVRVRAAGDVNVLDSFPQERTGGGRGRAVITASSAMEYAFEGERLADDRRRRPSVFTSALVQGLATGEADRDEDGWVSLNELYDYVFDKVREQNPHQTPSRQVELEGELYLARSRRRRIRPAPIPPDLQAALTDPNMYTRLGAVSELQSRLASDNLPVAAGAYEALAELARTDIRYVADPAAAALSLSALHPEETEVHFGEQRQGSAPPHRTVRLLGPPIARTCVPRASHDWIRVNETAEGFDISVDTANAGLLRGTLDLKGPTGEAVIAVDVELLPPAPQQTPLPPENESPGHRLAATRGRGQPGGRAAGQGRQAEQRAEPQAKEQAQREAQEASPTSPATAVPVSPAAAHSGTAERAATPPVAGQQGKQTRDGSRRRSLLWAAAGILAAAVVAAVAVPLVTSSSTPKAGPASFSPSVFTSSPAFFREDFSSNANAWTVRGPSGSGLYSNGTYRIDVEAGDTNRGLAEPTRVPGLNPAPSSITIEVSARPVVSAAQSSYGIFCRADRLGNFGYGFLITNGYAVIGKIANGVGKVLASVSTTVVRANGTNQLRAACTSAGGQNAVHLVFWVNGNKLDDVTDTTKPITGGTVGLGVSGDNKKTASVEFDNFVVTRT
jgi:hypothetical protein